MCNFLLGYEIEVWYCDVDGVYLGDISDSVDVSGFNLVFCMGNEVDVLSVKWFRVIVVIDVSGRINLKSCFFGWYSS